MKHFLQTLSVAHQVGYFFSFGLSDKFIILSGPIGHGGWRKQFSYLNGGAFPDRSAYQRLNCEMGCDMCHGEVFSLGI